MTRFYHYLRRRNVFRRVNNISVFVGSVSLMLVTLLSVVIYVNTSMRRLSEREHRFLEVYSANVLSLLVQIDDEMRGYSQEPAVQALLRGYLFQDTDARYLALRGATLLTEQHFSTYEVVTDVYVFTIHGFPLNVYRGPHATLDFGSNRLFRMLYDNPAYSGEGVFVIDDSAIGQGDADGGVLLCARRLYAQGNSQNIGLLVVCLDKALVFKELADETYAKQGLTRYVASNNDQLIYRTEDVQTADFPPIAQHIDGKPRADSYPLTTKSVLAASMPVHFSIPQLEWDIVTTIPYGVLAGEIIWIVCWMLLVLMLFVLLSFYTSKEIALSVSTPINGVLESLRAIQREDFSPRPRDEHNDELAQVQNMVGDTAVRIEQLLGAVKGSEQEKFELHFQALQAQINPHFLVNTLNSVVWLSKLQGADNIGDLTVSLIDVLVASMHNDGRTARLSAEIDLLKSYVNILQYRYINQFVMRMEISEEALSCYAPKFFLQPLLENCLIHGLDSARMLEITLSATIKSNTVVLRMADNGRGMPPERLAQILAEEDEPEQSRPRKLTNIGIRNIRRRLDLLYGGRPYGLEAHSMLDAGTEIIITIPMRTTEDGHE